MTRPARRKPDGRRHNGRGQRTELSEAQILVSGPEALLASMRARAFCEHVSTREAWRRAARAWLGQREVT